MNFAIALSQEGDMKGAEANLRRVIAIEPTCRDAHGNFATILRQMGRKDEAALHFRRLLALNPKHHERGNIEHLISLGEMPAAAAAPPSLAACANCWLPPPGKPMRCTRCNRAWFCDRLCQLAAWPQHKKPCKRAAKAAKKAAAGGGGGAEK